MISRLGLVSLSLCALMAALTPQASAGDRDPGNAVRAASIQLTVTLTQQPTGKAPIQKTYELVGADGEMNKFMASLRVPIPATPLSPPQGEGKTTMVTSFSYQNVGFQANYRSRLVEGGAIRLDAHFEISDVFGGAAGTEASAQPVINTFSQEVAVDLRPGAPTPIYKMQLPEAAFSLTVLARIVK